MPKEKKTTPVCEQDYEEKMINKILHCRFKGDRIWQEVQKDASN